MPKEEWGVKRQCPKCSVRFYDLQNDPMTCPSCESSFDLASFLNNGKSRGTTPDKADPASKAKGADLTDDVDLIDDEDDDADVDIDDDLLDDDDDEDTVNIDELADVAKEDDES